MSNDTLHGRDNVILFLKATTKKQVWIPQFTKKNGQVVGGHYAMVHVSDDHDPLKVATGGGSHSQKKAHALLSKEEGDAFHALSTEDKAALVMHHATQIQDMDSLKARLSTLKIKLAKGEKPLGSELKAFHTAPQELKDQVLEAAKAAGKTAELDAAYAAWVKTQPAADAKPAEEAATTAAKPAEAEKPAEDTKPVENQAQNAGTPAVADTIKAALGTIEEKAAAAAKVGDVAELQKLQAGMATALTGLMPEAQEAGKQTLAAIEKHLEQVQSKPAESGGYDAAKAKYNKQQEAAGTPTYTDAQGNEYWVLSTGATKPNGQIYAHLASKDMGAMHANGFHPKQAADYVDEALIKHPKKEAAAAAQADTGLAMPEFDEGKNIAGVKAYYEKVAQKIIDHAKTGNVAVLEDMKDAGLKPNGKGKIGNTWLGKTGNSKKILELHAAALAYAKGETGVAHTDKGEGDTVAESKPAGMTVEPAGDKFAEAKNDPHADLAAEVNASGFNAKVHAKHGVVLTGSEGFPKTYANQTQASNAAQKLADMGFDAEVIGMHPYLVKINGKIPGHKPAAGTGLHADIAEAGSALAALNVADSYTAKNGKSAKTYNEIAEAMEASGYKDDAAHYKQLATQFDDGPKDGDTKEGADGTLVFKDGRWHKQDGAKGDPKLALTDDEMPEFPDGMSPLMATYASKAGKAADAGDLAAVKDAKAALGHLNGPVVDYIDTLIAKMEAKAAGGSATAWTKEQLYAMMPGMSAEAAAAVAKHYVKENGSTKTAYAMAAGALFQNGHEEAGAELGAEGAKKFGIGQSAAEPAAAPSADFNAKVKLAESFMAAKVDASNTNAKSYNPKVDAIVAALDAGDVAALEVMKFGVNTYGKKLTKMKEDALKFLNAPSVDAPVKLKVKKIRENKPAEAAAPAAAAEPNYGIFTSLKTDIDEALAQGDSLSDIKDYLSSPQNKNEPGSKELLEYIASKQGAQPAAKPGIPEEFKNNFEVKNFIFTLKNAHKQQPGEGAKEWVDAADLAGYEALTPEQKAKVHAAIVGYGPNAQNNLTEWLAWHDHKAGAPAKLPVKPEVPATAVVKFNTVNEIEKAFEAGNAAQIKVELKAISHLPGFEAVTHYAKECIEHLEKHGTPAAEPQAEQPVPAFELPKPNLDKVAAEMLPKLKALAAAGDIAGLKDYKKELEDMSYGHTAAYAGEVIAALEAKQAASKPVLSDAEIPALPSVNAAYIKKLNEANDMAKQGDLAALKKISKGLAAVNAGKSKAHVDALITKLEAKGATEDGPTEGDTKQGANGMLIFQNGRWHKMPEVPTLPADIYDAAHSVKLPKFGNSGTGIKKAKAVAVALQAAAAQGKLAEHMHITELGTVVVNAGGYKFSFVNGTHKTEAGGKLKDFALALHAKLNGKVIAPSAGSTPEIKSGAALFTKPAAPHEPSPAAPEAIDGWTKTAGQKGYNEGGFYKDANGKDWYAKFPAGGEGVVKNELLANQLAKLAGLNVPELKVVTQGGKVGLASAIIPGAKENKQALLDGKAKGLLDSFATHAWLANWDAVGNNPSKGFDNILIDDKGVAHHIDQGGALAYGGAGGKKSEFGDKVIELQTMLNPAKNANTHAVFGKMSPADIAASVKKVASISDETIMSTVLKYGPGTTEQKMALANKLIARKKDMLAQYPQVQASVMGSGPSANPDDLSWVKLKAGEKIVEHGSKFGVAFVKIEVPAHGFNAAGIPKPYTYDKSSSQFVNAANTADIKKVYDTALSTHDPEAVKGVTFEQIVKATGEKTGKMITIDEHPSTAYVKEYVNQVAAELEAQLKPTYRVEHRGNFASSYGAAAADIAAKVKTIAHEKFKSWAHKAADYLVLDKEAGVGIPVPEAGMFKEVEYSSPELKAFKAASDAGYEKLSSAEKSACKAYTGNAYWNWNAAMRLGNVDSADFKAGAPMRKAFSKAAVELPEGIILHRGLNVGGDTYKSVMGAVIQDGSFQSASYGSKAAFSGKTSQLRLHITKGVKGMMATTFSGFGTGESEIILHPNCRYVVMKVETQNGKNVVDVLVLPHEE